MPAHRATDIITALKAAITGLATAGSNVSLERDHAWPESTLYAIEIEEGSDEPLQNQSWTLIDSELTVYTTAIYKGPASGAIAALGAMRSEITVALMAWITAGTKPLGIAYCIDLIEGPADEVITETMEYPVSRRRLSWRIQYRRSRTNPTA